MQNTTGILALGVTGNRYVIDNDPGGNEVGVIRGYDVFGSANFVVPEPLSRTGRLP
jgi:hypothetical protein